MDSNKTLYEDILDFLDYTGMSEGQFGQLAMGDRHLIKRLRSGGGVTVKSMDKIDMFMEAYEMVDQKKSDVLTEFM